MGNLFSPTNWSLSQRRDENRIQNKQNRRQNAGYSSKKKGPEKDPIMPMPIANCQLQMLERKEGKLALNLTLKQN